MSNQLIIAKYFPDLDAGQQAKFEALDSLYREWNQQINVISRKDIDNLYIHHILHSLSIARFLSFEPSAKVLDLGTGGGFPGIPLAILFPDTKFTLIDGTRKKIKVVEAVTESLNLVNVKPIQLRAEECKMRFDFVVSRAVASTDKLIHWSRPLLTRKHHHALPNGLICLKGGDPKKELDLLADWEYFEYVPLTDIFEEPFFDEKYLLYIQG